MLKSMHLPNSTIGENPITFPAPGEHGALTVLCGPNGAGKTFILRALYEMLGGKKAGYLKDMTGWSVETSGMTSVSAFRPQHHSSQMNSIGTMSLEQGTKSPRHNDDPLRLKVRLFGAAIRSLEGIPEPTRTLVTGLSSDRWIDDPEVRREVLEGIKSDEERVFWSRASGVDEIIRCYETATGFRLGVRRAVNAYELVAAYPDGSAADYGNWSDGQKSLFSIMATVLLEQPEVYIFDEIENYLHPAYMTMALDFLRERVPQTVIASHHPHLIFGRSVDEVFYVEKVLPRLPRFATTLRKQLHQEAPKRKITRLSNNHTKLANAYRLFDLRDSALLAAATYVTDTVDYAVNDAVYHLFECNAADASRSPLPDRQSQAIADLVAARCPVVGTVLDWGAGLARVQKETRKLGKGHPIQDATWVLYDQSYSETGGSLGDSGDGIVRLSDRRHLSTLSADVALLTNVLHILPLEAWTDAIHDVWSAVVGAPTGLILITEIFPLLDPERNALPIPKHLLEAFFIELGFTVYSREFEVRGAKSYCLSLTSPPKMLLNRDLLRVRIKELWFRIEADLQNLFQSLQQVESPVTRNEIMNAAFGIASIRSRLDHAS